MPTGARSEKDLPVGVHPIQLYSLGTPNGVKVTLRKPPFRKFLNLRIDSKLAETEHLADG
jgi:hypothetical protein